MGKINTSRVIIAGIAAGVVVNVGEALSNLVIFANQLAPVMESMGVAEPGGAQIGMYNLLGLACGITVAWIYAAMRPRLGPGPSAGVCAGLVAWALFSLFNWINFMIAGLVPVGLALAITVYQAVEFSAAGLIAGMLYKED